jgi:sec-independent protein translocase protein TatA
MELAIVLIIALVIFGPSKLPELGKSAGKGFREFKDGISGADVDEAPKVLDKPSASNVSYPAAPAAGAAGAPAPESTSVDSRCAI